MARQTKKTSKTRKATTPAGASVHDYGVLLEPVVTEKSSLAGADGTRVVFRVDPRATKTEIKHAVQRVFNVEVASVRTCNVQGKVKRTARSVGRRADYKKAYVTVKKGQTIDVVEGL